MSSNILQRGQNGQTFSLHSMFAGLAMVRSLLANHDDDDDDDDYDEMIDDDDDDDN